MVAFEIDDKYWSDLKENHDEASDKLAQLIKTVEMHVSTQNAYVEQMTLSINAMKEGRRDIVSEAAKCFSDVMGRINMHRQPDEHIFDTAMRIVDAFEANT